MEGNKENTPDQKLRKREAVSDKQEEEEPVKRTCL